MFKHLKIASRFLLRNRQYSLVNTIGLALSLVSVLLISLYLYDELSYDRMHSKADRIYRVIEHQIDREGNETELGDVAFRISTVMDEIPSIEETMKITVIGRAMMGNDENENKFYEQYAFADASFMSMFDFQVVYGDRSTALSEPNTVILTRSTAIKFFGTDQVVGKIIRNDRGDETFTVSAVIEDFPSNSHLNFNLLYSFSSLQSADWYKSMESSDWSTNYFSTYYLLEDGADPNEVSKALTKIVNDNRPDEGLEGIFWLEPLPEIHFHAAEIYGGYENNHGEIAYVYIFGVVGIFILTIALVNYVNLATAMSAKRSKEIGVKKVTGASRASLAAQFITESTILTFIALLIALAIVNVLLPSFNTFTGKAIASTVLFEPSISVTIVVFALLVGVLAGSYPAFRLSTLRPVQAIKGANRTAGGAWMRQGLVVFQFFLSIALIIATLTAYKQIEYIRSKDLGFNQEQLVVADINSGLVRNGATTIKNEIMKMAGVSNVTISSRVPGEWKNLPRAKSITSENLETDCYFIGADEDFLKTYQIILVDGKNFRGNYPQDSTSVLINETAAKLLGITEPGIAVSIPSVNMGVSDLPLTEPFRVNIIGIVKDFNFQSLHQQIAPLMIAYHNNPIHSIDYFTFRIAAKDMGSSLKEVQSIMYKVDPNHLLEHNFLDERLADFYQQDVHRSRLFAIAAIVAIGLACLGLFSLVSFNTEQRTKEIGVRKVLGASVSQITVMLCSEYVKLVAVGLVVAIPVSIWALNEWLSSFAYRVDVNWVILIVSSIISFLVTILTVGFKSLRAAVANPSESLRTE